MHTQALVITWATPVFLALIALQLLLYRFCCWLHRGGRGEQLCGPRTRYINSAAALGRCAVFAARTACNHEANKIIWTSRHPYTFIFPPVTVTSCCDAPCENPIVRYDGFSFYGGMR